MDWQNIKLREKTRELVKNIAGAKHEDFVESIILFGSEAKGSAKLTSDVDIAVVSSKPLNMKERLSILSQVPHDLYCDVDVRVVCLRRTSLDTTNKLDIGYSIKREGVVIYENVS
jgi:predicted nucleotidyltransferase